MWRRIKNLWAWSDVNPQDGKQVALIHKTTSVGPTVLPPKKQRLATIIDMSKKDDDIQTAE